MMIRIEARLTRKEYDKLIAQIPEWMGSSWSKIPKYWDADGVTLRGVRLSEVHIMREAILAHDGEGI